MGRIDNYDRTVYNGEKLVVLKISYKGNWGTHIPIIINERVFNVVRKFDLLWNISDKGVVYCTQQIGDDVKSVNLHDIVKKIYEGDRYIKKPIVHINRIGLDNRYENLIYDTPDKDINKNLKKKSRTIQLPKDSGINVENIPTYVWYLKSDDSHGDRFSVDIGDVLWKSTSSTLVSLKYKLEETKKYLRYLKKDRSDLFEDFSMNGDYNKEGLENLKSFYDIVIPLGYKLKPINKNSTTTQLLQEDLNGLTNFEVYLLKNFNPSQTTDSCVRKRSCDYTNFIIDKLPQYCKYSIGDNNCGEYFYIDNHPDYDGVWKSSDDKCTPLSTKLKELKYFLKKI
jgi:hypothetical protein